MRRSSRRGRDDRRESAVERRCRRARLSGRRGGNWLPWLPSPMSRRTSTPAWATTPSSAQPAGEVGSLSVATTTNNTVKSAARVGSGGARRGQFRQCNGDRHFAWRRRYRQCERLCHRRRRRQRDFHSIGHGHEQRGFAGNRGRTRRSQPNADIEGSLKRVCRKRRHAERRQFVGHGSVNRHRGRPRPGFWHGPGDCRRV